MLPGKKENVNARQISRVVILMHSVTFSVKLRTIEVRTMVRKMTFLFLEQRL